MGVFSLTPDLTPDFQRHDPRCDCFECTSPDSLLAQDHADPLLWINDKLGFGIKAGDVIETTKVVMLYGGKTATGGTDVKAISPPRNFRVFGVDDKFVTFDNDPNYGQYKGYFINNDPSAYVKLPGALISTVNTGQAVEQKIEDIKNTSLDFLSGLGSYLKWGLIGIAAILVLLVILRFTQK